MKNILFLFLFISLLFCSCKENFTPEELKYISEIETYRIEKNILMRDNPSSPFNSKSKIEFEPLNYFEVDPSFVFYSRLYEYPVKDTLNIYGTKGEERETVRYGYLNFDYENITYKLNVYKSLSESGEEYYSIWFTDRLTNKETYGVGRYLDFELNENPDFIYQIDFNLSFNPYCAYSSAYSCAIPTKEDYLDIEIAAGEKIFHH